MSSACRPPRHRAGTAIDQIIRTRHAPHGAYAARRSQRPGRGALATACKRRGGLAAHRGDHGSCRVSNAAKRLTHSAQIATEPSWFATRCRSSPLTWPQKSHLAGPSPRGAYGVHSVVPTPAIFPLAAFAALADDAAARRDGGVRQRSAVAAGGQ